ncbi:MAG TPA: heme o synthase [Longimicrobiales bacterium]
MDATVRRDRPAGASPGAGPGEARLGPATWRDFVELTKPGITRLVLLTTGVGYYLAVRGAPDLAGLVHTLVGAGLVASGTNALNQYLERDVDARMLRTRARPLPSGRMRPREALVFASSISVVGLLYLLVLVGALPALLVGLSLASYAFVYTPLKRRTSLSTMAGAVPGALPILAGWVAGGGDLGPAGWALFAILFLWQFPHVLALGWLHREDYARGRLRMLSVEDPDGRATALQAVNYGVVLVPVSLLPSLLGVTGGTYLAGALVLGLTFLATGGLLLVRCTRAGARRLFFASVVYLPALLGLMVLDKIPR